ncbi:phytanoyl-CoA dioxygenase family protein [Fimbriiglobus ruber]|uniref:Phytanoyl-CoA dioxygenase, peroxisomal n=1 Tax=Fimbriiglobus ruber TaxID=1908690 RepID=A0A225DHS7_9BACT|nr:phytanoyl-CoA dioxygenase family protein [Fimbriiglobus ruber]OWK40553.1 Phytanoyl-CoA dioxygenase, peroxisomal precursor [Fimbriiglobus ruber]
MSIASARASRALTGDRCDAYHADGYLIVRGLFHPTEMALVSMEADRLLSHTDLMNTDNIRCRWQPHCESGDCLFETFDPVIDLSPLLAILARDPRLLAVIADLYGEPAHLFKDKLIFKPAGAKGHDLHQDYISWPTFPTSFVTAAVAIDPCAPDNGCTEVYPGVHRRGYLSPADGDYHPLPEREVEGVDPVPLVLAPGDVAIFGGYTPHRSAPNRSTTSRRLLYLSYNADSDGGEQRDAHYREFHVWIRGKYAEYGKHQTYFR